MVCDRLHGREALILERVRAGWQRLEARRPRAPAATLLLIVHVAGGVFAVVTLQRGWAWLPVLRLIGDHIVQAFGLPTLVSGALVPVCVASLVLVVLLAAVESGRTLWRWRRHQPEPDVGLRLRALAYVAVACIFVNAFVLSTSTEFSGPFRLRFPVLGDALATFSYGAWALWSMLLPRLRRRFTGRVWHRLDLLGLNVVLALVLAEISLRILATFWASPILVTGSMPDQLARVAGRQRPGSRYFNFPVNQGGHYDSEFAPRSAARDTVVVSIGDSFSYGSVPHAFHYTTVAERESPGVQIYNMGYPNIGPFDYLHLLVSEALPLQPDLVIVQLFMGNDVSVGTGLAAGPPRWHDADSYLVAIVWHRLRIMRRARLAERAEVVGQPDMTREQLAVVYPWLADPLLEKPTFSAEVFLDIEARNARGVCLLPDAAYERFFRILANMERAAALGGVQLAFVLIPGEFQVEDDLWEQIVRKTGQPLERDRPQRQTVAWLNARGRPVLDLLPLLRAAEPLRDGRRHVYHRQDTHFNARGNEVAGRALARFVDSLRSPAAAPPGRRAAQPAAVRQPMRVALPFHLDFADSTARRRMSSGWHAPEAAGGRTFVWSSGARSVLTVPLPRGGAIRLDFEVMPFAFPRSPQQRVTIALDGDVIEELRLRPGLQKYSIILRETGRREPVSTVEFRYAWARTPQEVMGSADIRSLAVAWYAIDFAAVSP